MDFSKLDARDILYEDALAEYQRGMQFFWLDQLLPLNNSIYVMEQILRFPFDLFVLLPKDGPFFPLVLSSLYQAGLLTITRLATDTKGNGSTLPQFKNWVCRQVRPKYRDDFQALLRKTKFDKTTLDLLEKAKKLRDGRAAHYNRDLKISEQDLLSLEELQYLRDSLNSILDTLSFSVENVWLSPSYSPEVSQPKDPHRPSDIERILDSIARDSSVLNMPEAEPHVWSIHRKRLSKEDLEVLNRYRAKFGLPEV